MNKQELHKKILELGEETGSGLRWDPRRGNRIRIEVGRGAKARKKTKSWKKKPDPEMGAKTGSRSLLRGKTRLALQTLTKTKLSLALKIPTYEQRSTKEVASRKRR